MTETKIKKKRTYKRKSKAEAPEVAIESPAIDHGTPIDDHRENLNTDAVLMGDVVPSVGPSLSEFGEPDIVQSEAPEIEITTRTVSPRKFPFGAPADRKKKTINVLTMSSLPSRKK